MDEQCNSGCDDRRAIVVVCTIAAPIVVGKIAMPVLGGFAPFDTKNPAWTSVPGASFGYSRGSAISRFLCHHEHALVPAGIQKDSTTNRWRVDLSRFFSGAVVTFITRLLIVHTPGSRLLVPS